MELIEILLSIRVSHTLRTVLAGSAVVGAAAGMLGCFSYLRREALVGSVVGHAAFAGITGAFLIVSFVTGSSALAVASMTPGALVAGVLAMLAATAVVNYTPVKSDTAMAISMSVFFGVGIFLLRIIQTGNLPERSAVAGYMFGQAALLTQANVRVIVGLAGVSLAVMTLLWKELKLMTFDRSFGAALGYPAKRLDYVVTTVIVLAVVVGLSIVGVVLMAALLVAPAAAARQWTRRLSTMVLGAGAVGAVSGAAGALISAGTRGLPTGPVIVLVSIAFAVLSVLFAPHRGVVWGKLERHRAREHVLRYTDHGAGGRA